MRNKRKPSVEDGIPIVTYSRLPADRETPDDGPHGVRDADPWLDGVEVPLVERQARGRAAPDIRADAYDERAAEPGVPPAAVAAADLFAEPKRRRSRVLTYLAVIAVIAILGGLAILALGFHAATTVTAEGPALAKDPQVEIADLQKQIDALANSSGPASEATRSKIAELEARLADLEAAKTPAAPAADAAPTVRTIPTDGTPAAEAAPPPPRERPAKAVGAVRAEARAAPEPAEKPAVMELVAPVTSVNKTPAGTAKSKPSGVSARAGSGASDADFIANVEKALADAPPDPSPARHAAPLAAAPAAPVALAPADEEPGGVAPADAPSADALPTDIGPAIRTVPRGSLPADAAPADAAPLVLAPQAAAPVAANPDAGGPAPATFDPPPAGAFDIRPQPGTPVPPEPIPNAQ